MRVVCLVPSWTETLVEAGVEVVGRTRFCIHPKTAVASIPVVGGTKDIDWDKVKSVHPDLLILDQEENPKKFKDECPFPVLTTHVLDLNSMATSLESLAVHLHNQKIKQWADELRQELKSGKQKRNSATPPGTLASLGTNAELPLAYVIWRHPWMVVQPSTLIGSILEHLGWILQSQPSDSRYPEVSLATLRNCNGLYSSEPYPFFKQQEELKSLSLNGWIVDGECFSWYGIRALRFLQSCRNGQKKGDPFGSP